MVVRGFRLRRKVGVVVASVGLLGGLAVQPTMSASAATSGGTLTVLEESDAGGTWTSLDPTSPAPFLRDYEDSVFGQMFEINQKGTIVPDLAKSWKLSQQDKTLTIHLRPAVKFTDGTSFNAKAVAFNFNRDFDPKTACTCLANFPVASVSTSGNLTVVMHLKQSDPAIIEAFSGEAPDWIVSPTALQKLGAQKFAVNPVGAGPFKVETDNLGNTLTLVKNPSYWKKGFPKLNTLKFQSISSDQSALQALYAGDAQVYMSFTAGSLSLLPQVKAHGLRLYTLPAVSSDDIQFDTLTPPFNNIKAREALYYAIDTPAIVKHLFANRFPIEEGICAIGCDFYEKLVPGYRTYDPAKAKALVKQLGGLSFDITTYQSLGLEQTAEAVQAEGEAVGMKITVHPLASATVVTNFKNHTWQTFLAGVGSTDPALATGPATYFTSTGPDSGVHDPTLDKMIQQANSEVNVAKRHADYNAVSKYISDKAYDVLMFTQAAHNLSTPNVKGMTEAAATPWENVSISGS